MAERHNEFGEWADEEARALDEEAAERKAEHKGDLERDGVHCAVCGDECGNAMMEIHKTGHDRFPFDIVAAVVCDDDCARAWFAARDLEYKESTDVTDAALPTLVARKPA